MARLVESMAADRTPWLDRYRTNAAQRVLRRSFLPDAGPLLAAFGGVFLACVLSGCGGGGGGSSGGTSTGFSAASDFALIGLNAPQAMASLACLDAATVASIRSDARQVSAARIRCTADLNQAMPGLASTSDVMDAAFAAVVAYICSDPVVGDPAGFLTMDEWFALQAQNYFRVLQPDGADTRMHIVTMYGGAVGRRAQLDYVGSNDELILDPWAGVVVDANFDDVYRGAAVDVSDVLSFRRSDASTEQIAAQAASASALRQGSYRPSDLLYFQPSPAFYQAFLQGSYAALNTNAEQTAAAYPTPGGYQLAVDLDGLPGVAYPEPARFSPSELAGWVDWSRLQPLNHVLQCLGTSQLQAIRANPSQALQARQGCDAELQGDLASMALSPTQLDAVFATLLSHYLASYGSNAALQLADLLQQSTLDCTGYSFLASELLDIVSQGTSPGKLRMLGWNHAVFGNHAQLLYEEGSQALLLDPTTGLVAVVGSYDDLMSGTVLVPNQIELFYHHAPALESFVEDVYNSVLSGKYRPSDLLYFAPNPQFLTGSWAATATPADWVMNQYPTPGGYQLAVQMGFTQ